jgi:hypothetical protein
MNTQSTNQPSKPSSVTPSQNLPAPAEKGRTEGVSSSLQWSGSSSVDTMPIGPTAALPLPHREQLRERVEERIRELTQALNDLDGAQSQGGERAHAISSALESARVAMGGGWEKVGENEASQLASWLSTTADLRLTSPSLPPAAKA